jgi:hypothetical protein
MYELTAKTFMSEYGGISIVMAFFTFMIPRQLSGHFTKPKWWSNASVLVVLLIILSALYAQDDNRDPIVPQVVAPGGVRAAAVSDDWYG